MNHSEITILFGGSSDERRVSVASAQNLVSALEGARLWFLGLGGEVFECSAAELNRHQRPFEVEFRPPAVASGKPRYPSVGAALDAAENRAPVYFLGLHGGEHENGSLQREFERRGIAFTGSGSEASDQAFDKRRTKLVAAKAGARVCPETEVDGRDRAGTEREVRAMFERHHELILKPVAGGSSIGLYRVKSEEQLRRAVAALGEAPGVRYLIEPCVIGREITVGVIEEKGSERALPCSEVRLNAGHDFDYEGKYLGRGSLEITPAEISAAERDACQKVALSVHRALGCRGYTRTDLILSANGPVYLETNTLPGLTRASFIPQQLAAAGIPFARFLETQLAIARERANHVAKKRA
jgi:D-alanine-D-alanine ligase